MKLLKKLLLFDITSEFEDLKICLLFVLHYFLVYIVSDTRLQRRFSLAVLFRFPDIETHGFVVVMKRTLHDFLTVTASAKSRRGSNRFVFFYNS